MMFNTLHNLIWSSTRPDPLDFAKKSVGLAGQADAKNSTVSNPSSKKHYVAIFSKSHVILKALHINKEE